MKRLNFLLFAILPLLAIAQQKIAVVDVQQVFNALPEAKEAQQALTERNDYYQREYQSLQDDFNGKYAEYQRLNADAATPQSILDRRMQEIQADNAKIDRFLEDSKNELARLKTQLEAPLHERINDAIKAIATEQAITYVFDLGSSAAPVYSGNDAINITDAVIKRLTANANR